MTVNVTPKNIIGLSWGSVTKKNCCQGPAPSMRAAS